MFIAIPQFPSTEPDVQEMLDILNEKMNDSFRGTHPSSFHSSPRLAQGHT